MIPSPRLIVYDVEIAKTVEEVGGWGHKREMGVGVCSVYDLETDLTYHYDSSMVEELRQIFLSAQLRVGFNNRSFDKEVLAGVGIEFEWNPTIDYDIREEFVKAKGGGAVKGSLDTICMATINLGKSGNGAEAPHWFQQKKFALLHTYCGHDVALTAKLFRFICANGFVIDPTTQLPITLRRVTLPISKASVSF